MTAKAGEWCWLIFAISVAIALSVWGVALFTSGLPEIRFFWPLFFFGLGYTSFAGIVIRPLGSTSDQEIWKSFYPVGPGRVRLRHQGALFSRLSLIFFALGFLWLIAGLSFMERVSWFGDRPVVGVGAGATIFMAWGALNSAVSLYLNIAARWAADTSEEKS